MSKKSARFPNVLSLLAMATRSAAPALVVLAAIGCAKSAYYETYVPSAAD